MPFVLLTVGIVLLVAGVRNTVTANGSTEGLFDLAKGDFTGKGNFFHWFVAIIVIGGIGYVDELKPMANAFLALIIIGLFLSNGGFFSQVNGQLFSANPVTPGANNASTGVSGSW